MDDLERPSPKGMALRRPSLQPRTQARVRTSTSPALPRRHVDVDRAWADTGLLCALARRPVLLDKILDLYGASLVVAEGVAAEIRRLSGISEAQRTPQTRLLCSGADTVVRYLDDGQIVECPLPAGSDTFDTFDKLDRVRRQLRGIDAAAAERAGRTVDAVTSAHKHAGEMHSIVCAARTVDLGRQTVLLTNDGGAITVAESHGVPCKDLGQLLAELGCEADPVDAAELFNSFNEVTRTFATVPAHRQPADASAFRCLKHGDICRLCD
ncbi:hypothetical protein GCM10017771_84410 [Streptomyces capitiformicae]|uniref:Uncharacterized protein n=1 Tax=Streptomyces capitiformicae TaxID=2014920 RepID=A0A919DNS8_9ACTN|nr:hypothetical protein GCM10017771_84410 [Streptomyces capitiformicae]